MPAGYLVMIRGSDSHGFEALPQETLNLVNIAFPISLIDRIMGRYFDETDRWFHKEGSMPFETVLDVMRQRQLTLAFDRLVASAQDNFAVDHFLMDLFQLCAPQTALHLGQALPDWLETAMRRYTGEEFVSGGLETFFRLAGRSPEHVSRVMRKELDTCPSEWINRKKIEYARRLLEVGSAPVVDVASEAGFENLSYFYRLFKKNYGVSPKRFRSEHNRLI
jgi:AraC family cel operon transcriptional repressor